MCLECCLDSDGVTPVTGSQPYDNLEKVCSMTNRCGGGKEREEVRAGVYLKAMQKISSLKC